MADSSKKNVHSTHISAVLGNLHSAILDIVGLMNGPQRDEMIIREAGIRLDRALFPLLVLVERFGPIGVVELADRVGRDYTTVSRQLAKMETLGLITRAAGAEDRRVRRATIAAPGKAMTDRIDAARERVLAHGFRDWEPMEIEALAGLARKLADSMRDGQDPSP
jgi:DNA-binding MarR family transcriptional regulator